MPATIPELMRSAEEILFRLRQEASNLYLWTFPPSEHLDVLSPLPGLPDPTSAVQCVRETEWARDVILAAERILAGRLPLLGTEIETRGAVAWRRDYARGIETSPWYFRRIPYLDVVKSGDHKPIWELNRHQHLVLVAQSFLLTGDGRYSSYVFNQLDHWSKENPFQKGINWASALEVAFRAMSWIWIYHFTGSAMPPGLRQRFLTDLSRHGYHLESNLSLYFSPNTHLLGEAVALHAIGALFSQFQRAAKWRDVGRTIVLRELERQMHADGSHFEHSTYYDVYAFDFFLFHHVLEPMPPASAARLPVMAEFLTALTGLSGLLPFLGDDDGGRLFHPFGPRNRFARATLATCSVLLNRRYFGYREEDLYDQAVWWLGADVLKSAPEQASLPASRVFHDCGIAVMTAGDVQIVVDAGPFGTGNAGHSHSDALSVVVRQGQTEILIDPGTYTYVGNVQWRNMFRGSAAHNTIRVDGRDQAQPAGPFRWFGKPAVEIHEWRTAPAADFIDATCSYAGFRHRRQIWFTKPDLIVILDTIEGNGEIEHEIEQFWHAGETVVELGPGRWRIGEAAELAVNTASGSVTEGWRSDVFGSKRAAPVIRIAHRSRLPARLATAIRIGGEAPPHIRENQ